MKFSPFSQRSKFNLQPNNNYAKGYPQQSSGINVLQPSYNNLFRHKSFSYIIAHIWNSLSSTTKSAHPTQQFRSLINNVKYCACQCKKSIVWNCSFYSFQRLFILNCHFLFSRFFTSTDSIIFYVGS